MKHMLQKVTLLIILNLTAFTLLAQETQVLLCDVDISNKSSPYKWQNISPRVPMYLYPDDALDLYRQLLAEYLRTLDSNDQQRPEVKQFIVLQDSIISKRESANLAFKPNIMGAVELSSRDTSIPINCSDVNKTYLIDMKYLTIAYKKIHDASFDVFRQAADAEIQRLNLQYQNLFDNGLPMWPQETWLNGLFLGESDAEEPSRQQLVLLRPSLGLGGNTHNSISENNFEAALGLELAGFVRYRNSDFSSYWGLSVLATIGEDAGIGYGLMFRYDDYVFGYSKRKKDANLGIGEDNEYLFIGYDLYNFMHKTDDKFRGYKQKVRAAISKIKEGN